MEQDENTQEFIFKLVPNLGAVDDLQEASEGFTNVAARFLLPTSLWDKESLNRLGKISRRFDPPISRISTRLMNNDKGHTGTAVTLYFTMRVASDKEEPSHAVKRQSLLLIEHVLGIMSLCAGIKIRALFRQFHYRQQGPSIKLILPPIRRGNEIKLEYEVPEALCVGGLINEDILSALFWLRRGMGEVDPIIAFSAIMLSLQIIARVLIESKLIASKCPNCDHVTERTEGDTALMKRLLTEKLGADASTATRLWKLRSAVIAHAGKRVTSDIILELIEGKFDAAPFAYKAISLALGLSEDNSQRPAQHFFATDAFMYFD